MLRGQVLHITGAIPATSFVQMPSATSQSLAITEPFLYIIFRTLPGKVFVIHLDVLADDNIVVRLSFSNMFEVSGLALGFVINEIDS